MRIIIRTGVTKRPESTGWIETRNICIFKKGCENGGLQPFYTVLWRVEVGGRLKRGGRIMRPTTFAKGNKRTILRLLVERKQAQADKAPRVALRIQAIILSLEKYGPTDIASLLRVPRSCVHEWIKAWNEYRMLGLLEGHRTGRVAKLSEEDKQRLLDIVDSGPVAFGLRTGVWTSPIIAKVIEEEFEVNYHPGHVRRLLKQIGLSVQRPTKKLAAADPKKQNKWIRYTQPNLKKKPEKKGR